MGAVVVINREGFTASTEVDVITNSALVTNPRDVTWPSLVITKGTITENAKVDLMLTSWFTDRIIDLYKSMTRVVLRSSQNTVVAEIPIRAGQTLVTDTDDSLDDVSHVFVPVGISAQTLSQPSQTAAWRKWRPGRQRDVT